jgi:hypothetical protein
MADYVRELRKLTGLQLEDEISIIMEKIQKTLF